ncbi:MAG: 30S ribosomal protein S6e [Candidatus Aenigmarchaeota archaeon ex4484_56]|nr:MAG: 30S ribosomal protein S6e [Candidatus Aenigmarchaeota archaeon ex4484_56]
MKVVISFKGKSFQKDVDVNLFHGKKIGDKINGDLIGLSNYEIQITGGSDKQGFPMKKGVAGSGRKKLLLIRGVGIRKKGIRRRKSVRGEVISDEIAQINMKIIKEGDQKFEELLKSEKKEE